MLTLSLLINKTRFLHLSLIALLAKGFLGRDPRPTARTGVRGAAGGHLDDLLQVPPGLLQGLHGEPGVGVGGHAEAFDLAVELGQLVEVGLG